MINNIECILFFFLSVFYFFAGKLREKQANRTNIILIKLNNIVMETFTSFLKYENNSIFSRGWGCGYVHIPKNHPILVKLLINENEPYFYMQISGFLDTITFSQWNDNGEFYIVGFDTSHNWNNMENSGEKYVINTTNQLKKLIDSYSILDAKKEVENYFKEKKEIFKDFL